MITCKEKKSIINPIAFIKNKWQNNFTVTSIKNKTLKVRMQYFENNKAPHSIKSKNNIAKLVKVFV